MDKTEYHCLKRNRVADAEGYWIAPVKPDEIERIRVMRNAQIDILRQLDPLTPEDQVAYYDREIWHTFKQAHPKQILMSIYHGKDWIGYGGLVHINWERKCAEVSFLFEQTRAADFTQDLFHYLALIRDLAFNDLKFDEILTETYTIRTQVREILEQSGFRLEKVLKRRAFKRNKWQDAWLHVLKRESD